jgi:nitroreductase
MNISINKPALDQLFYQAHSAHAFDGQELSDHEIQNIYDLVKWAPTAFNSQPARLVVVRGASAKARLTATLAPSNIPQVESASATIIVAYDAKFYQHLNVLWPMMDVRPLFSNNKQAAIDTAFRNSSMQGAYLIMALRALGYDCNAMSGFDANALNAEFFPQNDCQANFLITFGKGLLHGFNPRNPRLEFGQVVTVLD